MDDRTDASVPMRFRAIPRMVSRKQRSTGRAEAQAASRLSFSGDGLGYRIARRALDVAASLTVLTVGLPLMAGIALGIKLDSVGPVLFKHRRVGRNRRRTASTMNHHHENRKDDLYGQPFTLYKFRTMCADAKHRFPDLYAYDYSPEELRNLPIKVLVGRKEGARADDGTLDVDDPRVTRFGRWLRRTSLDELPNFINVLKGDMHVVGPRADIVENIRYYPDEHRAKHYVKPGVTGLAQTNGRGWLSFLQTNEHDLEYVRRRSLALDLKIIWKTIVVTLKGDGAY